MAPATTFLGGNVPEAPAAPVPARRRTYVLDTSVLLADPRALVRFDDAIPDPADGFSVNLHNNVWGTNFRMWFDDDLRYRFELDFGGAPDPDEENR